MIIDTQTVVLIFAFMLVLVYWWEIKGDDE